MIFKNLMNYVFQFLYFCDKKAGKKHTVEKHLFFLFKVYYSPRVDYTERRNIKRKKN